MTFSLRTTINKINEIIKKLYYEPPSILAKFFVKIMNSEISNNRPPYGCINEAVNFAFSYRSRLFRVFKTMPFKPEFAPFTIIPNQVPCEILALLEILVKLKPQRILEIGTERGGTLFLWTYIATEDATIISLDLHPGHYTFGHSYPYWKENVYKNFKFLDQRIHLIRGNSHDLRTLRSVIAVLDGMLDFLFIDGDHTYEGLKKDFEMYSPLVRRGGIIAFHDIVNGPPEKVGGVPRFWSEIKHSYRHIELVKDWDQGGFGIGVLYI